MKAEPDRVRWLFLDLNAYFASVEQQERPELRGKPTVVAPVMTDSTCCIAASYEAKAFGIKTGTKISEARALCPGLFVVEARPSLYVQYHEAIVSTVESCVPVASVQSIDEMACELWGRQEVVSEALALARHIKDSLRRRVGEMLGSSIGLAPNRFLAKLASDMQKPNGLTVIRRCDLPRVLLPLDLRDLSGIGPRMEKRLNSFGIETMEQLCRLSAPAMREAWGGVVGERYWAWLRGENVDEPETVRRSIGHSHVLSPERRTYAGVRQISQKLVSKAAVRLRKMNHWASGLALSVDWIGGREDHVRQKLDEVSDTPTLLKTLEKLWTQIPMRGEPLRVGVTCHPIVSAAHHTPSLFENPKQRKISDVVDRINNALGRDTVYFAALQDVRHEAPTRIAFTRIPDASEM